MVVVGAQKPPELVVVDRRRLADRAVDAHLALEACLTQVGALRGRQAARA